MPSERSSLASLNIRLKKTVKSVGGGGGGGGGQDKALFKRFFPIGKGSESSPQYFT